MKAGQSKDTMPIGELTLRFRYPDGRLSALVTIDGDWKIEVFANEETAKRFAEEHDLTIKEMEDGANP